MCQLRSDLICKLASRRVSCFSSSLSPTTSYGLLSTTSNQQPLNDSQRWQQFSKEVIHRSSVCFSFMSLTVSLFLSRWVSIVRCRFFHPLNSCCTILCSRRERVQFDKVCTSAVLLHATRRPSLTDNIPDTKAMLWFELQTRRPH